MKKMEAKSKVLLADSSEEFRLLLKQSLEESGEFRVVGDTGDGEMAWELIQQTDPDVVIMDVILPGLDGISLLQRMPRNERPSSCRHSAARTRYTRSCAWAHGTLSPSPST